MQSLGSLSMQPVLLSPHAYTGGYAGGASHMQRLGSTSSLSQMPPSPSILAMHRAGSHPHHQQQQQLLQGSGSDGGILARGSVDSIARSSVGMPGGWGGWYALIQSIGVTICRHVVKGQVSQDLNSASARAWLLQGGQVMMKRPTGVATRSVGITREPASQTRGCK
jgi:hypothetical protein